MTDPGLEADLAELRARLSTEMRERFSRDLPLDELLSDRWERARSLGFGDRASIYASAYVYGEVRVGGGTWIGPWVLLDGTGGLSIGSGCDVSASVQIYTHDTVERVLSEGRSDVKHASVAIQDHCHIGAAAIVLKGVTIGHHSVVGAAALVNRDVPPLTIVAGVPARQIGRVELDGSGGVTLRYA